MFSIKHFGSKILRQKAEPAGGSFKEALDLVSGLSATLSRYKSGVGIAAPQVGESVRIFVVKIEIPNSLSLLCDIKMNNQQPRFRPDTVALGFINPDVTTRGEMYPAEEGCLSIPGVHQNVWRPSKARVKSILVELDKNHTPREVGSDSTQSEMHVRGFMARIVMHEFNHLDGVLITDLMEPNDRNNVARQIRKQRSEKRFQKV